MNHLNRINRSDEILKKSYRASGINNLLNNNYYYYYPQTGIRFSVKYISN